MTSAEGVHELLGTHASDARLVEDLADVGQQGDGGAVEGWTFFGGALGAELVVGFEGEAGPVAAGNVGDGEEGTPVVGQAVVGAAGHRRVAAFEGGEVVFGPAGKFAAEDGLYFVMAAVEVGGDLVLFGRKEEDANGA